MGVVADSYLSLYIILAIGADDVFVFMDAWKQSYYMGPEINASLATRMAYVYRRAGLAMLITSFTTAFAFFFAAITAPIAQIQSTVSRWPVRTTAALTPLPLRLSPCALHACCAFASGFSASSPASSSSSTT